MVNDQTRLYVYKGFGGRSQKRKKRSSLFMPRPLISTEALGVSLLSLLVNRALGMRQIGLSMHMNWW